jgi:exosortase/archaeosortase family protein
MKRFMALYFIFLALLFMLFYLPTSPMATLLNAGQTKLTLFFLAQFLEPDQLKGIDVWINPQYKIIITQSCNGMIPILFLLASILAYPSSIMVKIFWMLLGYILFSMVNVMRLLFVVHITQTGEGFSDFYWSHDLLGNALLLFTGLGIFIAFIKTSSRA